MLAGPTDPRLSTSRDQLRVRLLALSSFREHSPEGRGPDGAYTSRSVSPRSNRVLIARGRGGGTFVGAVPTTIHLGAQVRGEKMDTEPKDDKPTDFDLEMAVFGAP